MACELCDRLTTEIAVREQRYAASRGRLASKAEDQGSAAYRKLELDCDDARIDLEMARLELEKHQNEHAWASLL